MRQPWIKTLLMITLLCGLYFVAMEAVEACPTCSTAVAEDDKATASNAGAGYTYSIALMMAAPFSILGVFAFVLRRSFKKAMAAQEAAALAEKQTEVPVAESIAIEKSVDQSLAEVAN